MNITGLNNRTPTIKCRDKDILSVIRIINGSPLRAESEKIGIKYGQMTRLYQRVLNEVCRYNIDRMEVKDPILFTRSMPEARKNKEEWLGYIRNFMDSRGME